MSGPWENAGHSVIPIGLTQVRPLKGGLSEVAVWANDHILGLNQ